MKSSKLSAGNKFASIIIGSCLIFLCFTAAWIFFSPGPCSNMQSISSSASEKEIIQDHTNLVSTAAESPYDNLLSGCPGNSDYLLENIGFALGYSRKHRQPLFVIYLLDARELENKTVSRKNRFLPDPEVLSDSASGSDYKGSGYDRGHLAPAADMAFSAEAMKHSFYYSNISPQDPSFNRGIWKKLEEQVRFFAETEKKIYVVSGPVFSEKDSVHIGNHQITVPEKFYKVIYDLTPPEKMIAFIIPNRKSSSSLQSYTVTVDHVENQTGLDFFNLLPDSKEQTLEKHIKVSDWQWLP